jgi:alpha-ribazole phosphatase
VPGGAITRWWWIRHAPAAARPGEILGRLDPPAALGRTSASLERLAARLPAGASWITSGALRCRQTAQALAAARGQSAEMLVEPDLIEQDFGAWQGLTHDEVAARYADDCARFWRDPARQAPPGGESFADMCHRVSCALERIAALGGSDLVLIAHAGTIRAALAQALGLDASAALRFALAPLSLTLLDRVPPVGGASAAWRVVGVNLPAGGLDALAES